MKKVFMLLGLLSVAACAQNYDCAEENNVQEPCPYQEPAPVVRAPVQQPCYECNRPVVQQQAPCQGEVRTVREPVEVVYKRTTYGTVYEPRYFENVAYERQMVNGNTTAYTYETDNSTISGDEQEYVVPVQQKVSAPVVNTVSAPDNTRKYNGPVVIVPVQ